MTEDNRRAYIVTAHPDEDSLTLVVARRIARAYEEGGGHARITNLAAVGFAPAFDGGDLTAYRTFIDTHAVSAPKIAESEHEILDAATDLVLVFPVHWWSFPAQMKGWIDRVFTGGWAWGAKRLGRTQTGVAHLRAHVVAITGAGEESFAEAGYDAAMRVQIEDGILRYCGFGSTTWSWIWDPAREDPDSVARAIRAAEARVCA